jgi:hypothetical protein
MFHTLRSWLGGRARNPRRANPVFSSLERLDDRIVPVARLTATGAAAGVAGIVNVYDADGSVRYSITPYGDFTGGVRVAVGDVNGDGTSDVVTAPGPGLTPQVDVFDGASGQLINQFVPFEDSYLGGVNVSVGNLGGTGVDDIVVSPDEGGGPRVEVLDGQSGAVRANFYGIDDPNFRGGVRTAVGDLGGTGTPDLIVAAGYGGGPRVAGFELAPDGTPTKAFNDFFAFEPTLRNGAYVAAGDVDGTGHDDLVFGGGPGGGPRVEVLAGPDLLAGNFNWQGSFFAGDPDGRGGVGVSVGNPAADGTMTVLTAAGDTAALAYDAQGNPVGQFAAGNPVGSVSADPSSDDTGADPAGATGVYDGFGDVVYATTVQYAGSRAWRDNNPGEVPFGPVARQYGAIGSDGPNAIFPDAQHGTSALIATLQTAGYQGLTLAQALGAFAVPAGGNPDPPADFIDSQTGMDPNATVGRLTAGQLATFANVVQTYVGWDAGQVYTRDDSAPEWVKNRIGVVIHHPKPVGHGGTSGGSVGGQVGGGGGGTPAGGGGGGGGPTTGGSVGGGATGGGYTGGGGTTGGGYTGGSSGGGYTGGSSGGGYTGGGSSGGGYTGGSSGGGYTGGGSSGGGYAGGSSGGGYTGGGYTGGGYTGGGYSGGGYTGGGYTGGGYTGGGYTGGGYTGGGYTGGGYTGGGSSGGGYTGGGSSGGIGEYAKGVASTPAHQPAVRTATTNTHTPARTGYTGGGGSHTLRMAAKHPAARHTTTHETTHHAPAAAARRHPKANAHHHA